MNWHSVALKHPDLGLCWFRSTFNPVRTMCGPVYDYSFEDFLNDASRAEWDEWESEAARLELPLDYYLLEFVGQS